MKNKRIIDAWNKVQPDSAADERILAKILARNHTGKAGSSTSKSFLWKRVAPIALCLVLAIAVSIPLLNRGNSDVDDIELKLSTGVRVYYAKNPPPAMKPELVGLSEDQLFASRYNSREIVAFEGTVTETRNIVCDFNGNEFYLAISEIKVSDVLRGSLSKGDTVTVLLPGPVGGPMKVEDTDVSSQLTVGMKGIFMPIKYAEDSIIQSNDATLYLLDLAEYGMLDGVRWMFLETKYGLVYCKDSYPSLAGAGNLEDIKEILREKLK